MILSFAYTTPALLAGAKSVTRRDWKPEHAAKFHLGDLVDAYDKSPRNGGRKVGVVRVLWPILAPIARMPDSDYEAEGFAWLHANGVKPPKSSPFPDFSRATFDAWRASGQTLYVVRFELVSIVERAAHGAGAAQEGAAP